MRSNTLAVSLLALLFAAACTSPMAHVAPDVTVDPNDQDIAAAYPTLSELYAGSQGIYRGCGPNGNVCHNARQYPNMNSLGSITDNIGQPCNQLQDDPTRIDDWCERVGDTVDLGDMTFQLGYIELVSQATDTVGSQWRVVIQGTLPMLGHDEGINIVRTDASGHSTWLTGFNGGQLTMDPARTDAVLVQLAADDQYTNDTLTRAGVPGDPGAIQFGDPNRDGVYGATLGNALIFPGHPERSYIIKRLTDPTAGPLMPLANCCFWTKPALRALWCWISSLAPDGSNALDPIDYGSCPDGPAEDVMYPTPGPMCTMAGQCPVRSATAIPDDATWANVYTNILSRQCAGSGCHFDVAAGGLDMRSSDTAYQGLLHATSPRVLPGDAMDSRLHLRITQTCTPGASCTRMPLGGSPLPASEIAIIDNWINAGALENGDDGGATGDAATMDTDVATGSDAGMDAGMDAATDAATDAAPDGE